MHLELRPPWRLYRIQRAPDLPPPGLCSGKPRRLIVFFRNNFASGNGLFHFRRGHLQTNHTKLSPAGFGGPIARCDITPVSGSGVSPTGPVARRAKKLTRALGHSQWPEPPRFVDAPATRLAAVEELQPSRDPTTRSLRTSPRRP